MQHYQGLERVEVKEVKWPHIDIGDLSCQTYRRGREIRYCCITPDLMAEPVGMTLDFFQH